MVGGALFLSVAFDLLFLQWRVVTFNLRKLEGCEVRARHLLEYPLPPLPSIAHAKWHKQQRQK